MRHDERRERVNISRAQHSASVPPEVFGFHIGGHQVVHKRVKDGRGRQSSCEEITRYSKIATALLQTIRLMREIDEAAREWPIR